MKYELSSVVRRSGHKVFAVGGGWTLSFVVWCIAIGMLLAIVAVLLSPEQ